MGVRESMALYFDRLVKRWAAIGSLPIFPFEEEFRSSPSVVRVREDGMCEWVPVAIGSDTVLAEERAHWYGEAVREYLGSYWFLSLGGRWRGRHIQLMPVYGPPSWDDFARSYEGYVDCQGGMRDFVPIGFESSSSLLLVVRASDGLVFLKDDERGGEVSVLAELGSVIFEMEC